MRQRLAFGARLIPALLMGGLLWAQTPADPGSSLPEPAIRETLTPPPAPVVAVVPEHLPSVLALSGPVALVAASPWLGLGVLGLSQFHSAPDPQHPPADWYAQSWFWVIAFTLVLLVLLKDVSGLFLPPGLKKSLDLTETILNLAGWGLALVAYLPSAVANHLFAGKTDFLLQPFYWGALALAATGYAAIALLSYGTNLILVLSPFPLVDLQLKLMRGTLVALLGVLCWRAPESAGMIALGLAMLGTVISAWSWRLAVYGSVFGWDLLGTRPRQWMPLEILNPAFTGRHFGGLPLRTPGYLVLLEGNIVVFRYRRWLFGRERDIDLNPSRLLVSRGTLNPGVVEIDQGRIREVLSFPPRYRSHELKLTQIYGFVSMREVATRGARGWLRLMLR